MRTFLLGRPPYFPPLHLRIGPVGAGDTNTQESCTPPPAPSPPLLLSISANVINLKGKGPGRMDFELTSSDNLIFLLERDRVSS